MKSYQSIMSAIAWLDREIDRAERAIARAHTTAGATAAEQDRDLYEGAKEALCWAIGAPCETNRINLGQSCDEPDNGQFGPSHN